MNKIYAVVWTDLGLLLTVPALNPADGVLKAKNMSAAAAKRNAVLTNLRVVVINSAGLVGDNDIVTVWTPDMDA
jgi:hypothetical protein